MRKKKEKDLKTLNKIIQVVNSHPEITPLTKKQIVNLHKLFDNEFYDVNEMVTRWSYEVNQFGPTQTASRMKELIFNLANYEL